MTLDTLIMLAGAFVAVLPFLGFPNSWDTVLFFIAGIVIIGLGIVVRRKEGERERKMRDGQ
jgi:VIT1/CCC1 family predicted Fe2+/Mn2+ transporter